jgi:hypothetical protein
MTFQAFFGRRWVRAVGIAGAAAAGYVWGITSDRAYAQLPGALPEITADKRVVAYIYGNIPVTREELGEFLIARGGAEKLELLVNKKIIEVEAARRNITVTATEVEAALNDDLKGLSVSKDDFVKHVLPRYGKTLYEWTEDVIKPRLMLSKMCRDQVKITDEDLRKAFENRYGEKRQAKVICWNASDKKAALRQWEEARKGDVEFDRVARTQADPNLAASCGLVAPVGRYAYAEIEGQNDAVEKALFSLKVGEMSQLFDTPAGVMCVKLVAIIPPDTTVTLDQVRANLERELFDAKMNITIPKFFKQLKETAQPNLLLKGPPTQKEFREGVQQLIQTSGIMPPTPQPMQQPPATSPPPKQ